MRKLLTFYLTAILAFGVGWAETTTVTIWSEDWSSGTAGQKASNVTNSNATYSETSGDYTKLYAKSSFTDPELLVGKSSRNDDFFAEITLNGASGDLTLEFDCNQNMTITSSTANVNIGSFSGSSNHYTGTITVPVNTSKLSLQFHNGTSSNARLSNLVLTYEQESGGGQSFGLTDGSTQGSVAFSVGGSAVSIAAEGDVVSLTATPSRGYQFSSWTAYKTGDQSTTVSVTNNSFTMPGYAVTVVANFTALTAYNLTSTGTNNGSVTFTVAGVSGNQTSAYAGETVTATATADSGYSFDSWTAPSGVSNWSANDNTATFTMPAADVNVTANFARSTTTYYTKVTSTDDITDGQYLIVYETDGVAFDGSLSTLDAANNYISVTISNNQIPVTTTTTASEFTIDKTAGTIKSASGLYIGRTADANELDESSTTAYTNTISYNSTNNCVDIVGSGGAYLRFNSDSNNYRFRYYKSTSYTSQQAIQLYKKDDGSHTGAVSAPTFNLTNNATYTVAKSLTMGCETNGATIYYTTDGTTPTSSSTAYASALTFGTNGTYTVTAIAIKDGVSSSTASVTFTIDIPSASTEEGEATFIFNTTAGLSALGITAPAASAGTSLGSTAYTSEDVTLTATHASTATRVYNSSGTYDLRVYSGGGSLTLAVPSSPAGYSITKVVIAGTTIGVFTVSPGSYSNGTWTGDAQSVTFTATGTAKINTITVTYTKPVSTQTVVGIAAFKQLAAGTTAVLSLPDSYNARVLHVESATGGTVDAYIRDNTGAILMKGINPNRAMAYNQHLAGWITGEYNVDSQTGVPIFVPVSATNTDQLVIADRVTEAQTLPEAIETDELSANLANWVTLHDVRNGGSGSPTITNGFNVASASSLYTNALVDVNGVVVSNGIYPVSDNSNYQPLTYVIDSDAEFSAPSSDIAGASIRWKRTINSGEWTPLTVPFAITNFDGVIMQYTSLEVNSVDNNTGDMHFTEANSIQPGVPYLVKSNVDRTSWTLDNVTLSSSPASTVSFNTQGAVVNSAGRHLQAVGSSDTYSLVGTYTPTNVAQSNTNKVFSADGNVIWADQDNTSVEGTSAYIVSPADQGLKLVMGDTNEVVTAIVTIAADVPARQGTYNMLGVKMPDDWGVLPPGVYIVNGKKMVKQ